MSKLLLSTAVATTLVVGLLYVSPAARADSLSCASANGVTRCTGSDGLDCQTVDGHMVCAPGSKGRCETIAGETICTNGSVTQSFRTGPKGPGKPNDDGQKRLQRQSDSALGDCRGGRLSIRQDPTPEQLGQAAVCIFSLDTD
jgi:hypothetical protein